ncbi:energy-coupling factor ABC transporter ATP-binding protein [Corynebacterium sp. TAE3-ERU12]|uniref:ABC transporter ATP-binding protein n=1 Tax=Corynebacterium sp. TAE3-ERU12 TaxID=2849491 RepID=UPI001C47C59B|nr:energy-coupling factor ABC transporter ATP-binding protein [Corynebacterium sp. TAE3-ERU12]
MSPHDTPAVRARGFGWRHGGRRNPALADIDLRIDPGERVLVLGASGAGKSTLLAAIAGVLGGSDEGEQTGELLIHGRRADASRGDVGLVLQDPDAQVISARVGDDVAFGAENLGIDREQIFPRVHHALDVVGLPRPWDYPTARLSGGQKQRLALAGVLAMGARIIALDEPTANIDPAGVGELRDAVIRAADDTGATVIVVEHRVHAWVDVVDRIIVVGRGGIIADGPVAQILADYGDALREDGVWIPGPPPEVGTAQPLPGNGWALATDNLAVGYKNSEGIIDPVRTGLSIELPVGASTCITGPNGCGKSTLALTLGGLLPAASGQVLASAQLCEGLPTHTRPKWRRWATPQPIDPAYRANPQHWSSRQLAARIGSVFQSPEHQFTAPSVREELLVSPKVLGVATDTANARVDELLERLRLSHLAKANPFTLSGGEKRRLSVATVLSTAPSVVLLDEPTFGQDRRTFTELLHMLRGLVDDGGTVVSITHDPLVVEAMGDHVIDLPAREVTDE